MNWNRTLVFAGAGSIAAVVAVVLAVGKALANRIDEGNRKNDEQLREQRRVKRELFGEDPDNPGGPRGPSLRDMVTDIALNTRTLPDRMSAAESRLGKLEDRFDLLEDVVLRRPNGGN